MASSKLEALFDDYAAYHRHPINKLTHYVGVPVIILTLVGLLGRVSLGAFSLAVPVAAAAIAYNALFSIKLTVPFAAFIVMSFVLSPFVPVAVLWIGFLAGWALQFIGHYVYEKKSPAFFKNLQQLLVGPLWLVDQAMTRR